MRTHGDVNRHKAKKEAKTEAKIMSLKAAAPGTWPAGTPAYLKEAVREDAEREGYNLPKALAKQREQAPPSPRFLILTRTSNPNRQP